MVYSERGLWVYLAYRVRLARARAGLSQRDLALAVFAVPYPQWIDQVERAHRKLTAVELYRLAAALGVSLTYVFPAERTAGGGEAQPQG